MLKELQSVLKDFLPQDGRPVVVYSGLLSIARVFEIPPQDLPKVLLECVIEAVGPKRTLVMPTYTNGFQDGFLNLDTEPCNTGMMNEQLRLKNGTVRTAASYWSFAAYGPDAARLGALRPVDAWGKDSVFDWIYQTNAHLLVLGVPWKMCSFLHRVEWDAKVPYRSLKDISGNIILRGKKELLRERHFVRSRTPNAENSFPHLEELFAAHGMKQFSLGNGYIAELGAQELITCLLPIAQQDSFAFVKNPDELRRHFSKSSSKVSHGH